MIVISHYQFRTPLLRLRNKVVASRHNLRYILVKILFLQYDLVRKPSNLDALIGYFTPSHIIHQRL